MKKISHYLLLAVVCLAIQSCSKDDEPKSIDQDMLSGEWYVYNIKGWEYDSDTSTGKYEFNETFNYNGQGIPIGDNAAYAQKILFSETEYNPDTEIRDFSITNYVWSPYSNEWIFIESGTVKLQGNQLIDGTLKVTINELSTTKMITYQKDEDGETYVTYVRL